MYEGAEYEDEGEESVSRFGMDFGQVQQRMSAYKEFRKPDEELARVFVRGRGFVLEEVWEEMTRILLEGEKVNAWSINHITLRKVPFSQSFKLDDQTHICEPVRRISPWHNSIIRE